MTFQHMDQFMHRTPEGGKVGEAKRLIVVREQSVVVGRRWGGMEKSQVTQFVSPAQVLRLAGVNFMLGRIRRDLSLRGEMGVWGSFSAMLNPKVENRTEGHGTAKGQAQCQKA